MNDGSEVLSRLDYWRVELSDCLAAWDEMPSVAPVFVEHMDAAYIHLCKAIGEMRLALKTAEGQASLFDEVARS